MCNFQINWILIYIFEISLVRLDLSNTNSFQLWDMFREFRSSYYSADNYKDP
jgi:hypothetical protein